MVRQSPSPVRPRWRCAPPSPSPRGRRHHRSSSPMTPPASDLEDLSSSEEGDQLEATVTTSEAEDTSDGKGERLVLSPVADLGPILEEASSVSGSLSLTSSPPVNDADEVLKGGVSNEVMVLAEDPVLLKEIRPRWCSPEVDGKLENSISESISVSPTLSPTSAVLFWQSGVSPYVMPDSVSSIFPPALGDDSAVSKGLRMEGVADDGVHGRGVLFTGDVLPMAFSTGIPLLSGPAASHVGGSAAVGRFAVGGKDEVGRCADGGGLGGDGLESEEGRFSPVAGEAVRPQPTDELGQPPSASVEPVIVGGDAAGRRGGAPGGSVPARVAPACQPLHAQSGATERESVDDTRTPSGQLTEHICIA
ncbi:hypothetical protein Dimus_013677 [Dionaea muscipula]